MVQDDKKKVTFNDVAGADEEKAELEEIVAFLKNSGICRPRGPHSKRRVVGRPARNRKTLLARAVAGEAGVPFFSISGSDFVEMFVGVGASRVRDLFETAKKNAPCIILSTKSTPWDGSGVPDSAAVMTKESRTLNQLLVEMDGFNSNEGSSSSPPPTGRISSTRPCSARAVSTGKLRSIGRTSKGGKKC